MSDFIQPEQGGILGAPWHLGYLASYDCETTGTDVEEARIVSAALVVPGREPRLWLADPGIEIPEAASSIHGITTEQAREHGQPAALVIDEIAEALADELATRSSTANAPATDCQRWRTASKGQSLRSSTRSSSTGPPTGTARAGDGLRHCAPTTASN